MLFRTSFIRGLAAAVISVSLATLAFGDTVRLKDGSIIKGKIVGFSGGTFTISIGEGSRTRTLTFAAAEIDSIQFDSPMAQPEASRRADIPTVIITNPTQDRTPTTPAPQIETTSARAEERSDTQPVEPEPEIVSENDSEIGEPEESTETAIGTVAETAPPESPSTSSPEPIGISVKVLADNTANGWTNTGWIVRKGQRIRIVGDGTVSLGSGRTTTASGLADLDDDAKLLRSVPTGALIAVIGDDNNDFIYIGGERTFTAARDGALFLGLNEGNLNDNTGAFDVRVEIDPGTE